MANQLAKLTQKMLKRLPYWFKMKKDPNAIGAQFLNVIGMELQEVKDLLDYASRQFYIGTVDLGQVDIVYKATVPIIPEGFTATFFGGEFQLEQAPNLTEFLTALATDTLHNPEIYYQNPYYMDVERRVVYVRQPYGEAETPPHGFVSLIVTDAEGRTITVEDLALRMHPVWNFLDEFGLLLDTPRLYGERNAEYKERLLAVFEFPANSSRRGLLNGLARDLSQISSMEWLDGSRDMALPHARVIAETITVDRRPFPASMTRTDGSGRTVLTGSPADAGKKRMVRYGHGVSVMSLTDRKQLQFQQELWTADGHGTGRLQYYVDLINSQVPVNWGRFLWDQGFWDVDQSGAGGGVVPAFSDAQVTGWRGYTGTRTR